MIRDVALVTDSNSQVPAELIDRYGVEVVPLTVVVDGVDYAEGVDLDADAFYARLAGGEAPAVSTAQPSPGAFIGAYRRAADGGAASILSVHVGSSVSGTLNSARIAADDSVVPVRLVDTGTASFGITCCLWEAAEALLVGADVETAAAVAERTAATVRNVFVVQALDLARRGGRVDVAASTAPGDGAVSVLSLVGGAVRVVATAASIDSAAAAMARYVLDGGSRLRVAVGVADAAGAPLSDALEALVTGAPNVVEVVRYRVGPSVGVHTGPGTAGAFFFPAAT
jgi:DegV family protein with EDD domain